jgi:hypothetical protein
MSELEQIHELSDQLAASAAARKEQSLLFEGCMLGAESLQSQLEAILIERNIIRLDRDEKAEELENCRAAGEKLADALRCIEYKDETDEGLATIEAWPSSACTRVALEEWYGALGQSPPPTLAPPDWKP